MSVNRPPRGVASLMGLVLSSTLWFMLNKSTVFSARRGRALQPVALSFVREKATSKARKTNQENITTQESRDWPAVVGRSTPKKTAEVPAEAGAEAAEDSAAPVRDASGGQAEKGDMGAPLPCASALGALAARTPALKLYRGREVNPGQMLAASQGVQAGNAPKVPLKQPTQERLCARAAASEAKLANAEGRRGSGQARGAQSAREAAEAEVGCLPGGQAKGRARHCVSCVAPVEAVVFPLGQAVHCVIDTAPGKPLKVPRGHCEGEVAPVAPPTGALKDPAGETRQKEEPAREAYVPALQGAHWERELVPGVEEAVPGGQEIQPLEV